MTAPALVAAQAPTFAEPVRPWVVATFDVIAWPILIYFLLINTSYLVLVLASTAEFRRHLASLPYAGRDELIGAHAVPGVTVVAPCYNEGVVIEQAVRSMLALNYPRHEVIVVNDGSADDTLEVLRRAFDLVEVERPMPRDIEVREPARGVYVPRNGTVRLTVIDKANSGRSDSVNVAVNYAREDLVVFMDGDSLLEPSALLAVARPFVDDPVHTVAAGGVIRAVNGCTVRDGRVVRAAMPRNPWARIQVVEYLRAFHLGRAGWSRLRSLILISGAFGIFRRDVLVEVGGLDPNSIGEDFELVLRVHKHMRRQRRRYRVTYVTEPICWTEVPESLAVLKRQRSRWHRGLWETLWAYRGMLLNPRYGRVGLIALPYYWLFELIAPLLEVGGLVLVVVGWLFGIVDGGYFLLFMGVAYAYAALVTLAALAIEELTFHKYSRWSDLVAALGALVIENVGYRQLTGIWRLQGWWASLSGRKQVWGTMTRTGFTTESNDGA